MSYKRMGGDEEQHTVLLLVEVLDAIARRIVVAELRLVFLLAELCFVVPHLAFQDID